MSESDSDYCLTDDSDWDSDDACPPQYRPYDFRRPYYYCPWRYDDPVPSYYVGPYYLDPYPDDDHDDFPLAA